MKFYDRVEALATAGLLFGLIIGCGGGDTAPKIPDGPKGSAKATVMYDGKPIKVGTLVLDSGKGFVAAAMASPDGKFELKGPNGGDIPAGTYRVGVSPPPAPVPKPGSTEMSPPAKIDGLPDKFYNSSSSGVTVEIKAGKQDIEIVLK